ncbi:hypothetical protein FACS189419_01390 [Planctomycetales bacterium]|nr:hypothetical protein FACS189419_01390 [Planctomycetales bacterium]
MNDGCRKIVTAHQIWLNNSRNYYQTNDVLNCNHDHLSTVKVLVDNESKKMYCKSVSASSEATFYIVDDFLGDVTNASERVGIRTLGTSKAMGVARPGGDGTAGVFKYGVAPEVTIKLFEVLGEDFQSLTGTGTKEGLTGLKYRFKRTFLEARTKGLPDINIGSKETQDRIRKLVDSVRNVVLWCDIKTGELRG